MFFLMNRRRFCELTRGSHRSTGLGVNCTHYRGCSAGDPAIARLQADALDETLGSPSPVNALTTDEPSRSLSPLEFVRACASRVSAVAVGKRLTEVLAHELGADAATPARRQGRPWRESRCDGPVTQLVSVPGRAPVMTQDSRPDRKRSPDDAFREPIPAAYDTGGRCTCSLLRPPSLAELSHFWRASAAVLELLRPKPASSALGSTHRGT